ncbi:MAG: hypothetical protein PHW24_02030 [Candidatus Moranbacteria bacterium]|nr:hypothetical protein [Candidatus Moranbacteria bacterium]
MEKARHPLATIQRWLERRERILKLLGFRKEAVTKPLPAHSPGLPHHRR